MALLAARHSNTYAPVHPEYQDRGEGVYVSGLNVNIIILVSLILLLLALIYIGS